MKYIVPMLGMLMLPKTICYILMLCAFLKAVSTGKIRGWDLSGFHNDGDIAEGGRSFILSAVLCIACRSTRREWIITNQA